MGSLNRNLRCVLAFATLALLGLAMAACESTDLTADPEGEIRVSANPGQVIIDSAGGETEGQSTITAQVFDSDGFAMADVAVSFISSGGTLASSPGGDAPVPVLTNANGVAVDVLTLTTADDSSVEVIARSGTLDGTTIVNKTVDTGNVQPSADVTASPSTRQRVNLPVTFSGLGSSDPDGQITCYQWEIDSTDNSRDEVVQGPSLSLISRTYSDPQVLAVTLRVSDDPAAPAQCQQGGTPAPSSIFSPNSDFINGYPIVCAINGPLVNAGADQIVSAGGGTVDVTLNGNATMTDAAIAVTKWNCANGTPEVNGNQVTCSYTNSTSGNLTFSAVFTATDVCGLSVSDTVNVVVTP